MEEIHEQLHKHPRVYTNKLVTHIVFSGVVGFITSIVLSKFFKRIAEDGQIETLPGWGGIVVFLAISVLVFVLRTLVLPRTVTFTPTGISLKWVVGKKKSYKYEQIEKVETHSSLRSDRKYQFVISQTESFQLVLESYETRGLDQLVRNLNIPLES